MPFLVQEEFRRTAECRCLSRQNFCERRSAVACPRGISTNGGMPLLVQTEFPRAAFCRCPSRKNFCERRFAVACPRGISTNGGMPLLVQAQSRQKRASCYPLCLQPLYRAVRPVVASNEKPSYSAGRFPVKKFAPPAGRAGCPRTRADVYFESLRLPPEVIDVRHGLPTI